jgi:hypothetical protein
MVSCVVVVFLNAKIYVFVLYKMAFHFLIFNLERHQRELFSPGQLQWLLPTTTFTRKSVQKKTTRFVYILTDFGIGSLVIIIYIGHYFLPIDYVTFILTQRLVTVVRGIIHSILCWDISLCLLLVTVIPV